jgi:hypothetical protein
MSTAFDMESLDMPATKIPSGDLTWGAMLLAAARVGPPLIVSTGMATLDEVRDALTVIAFGLTREDAPSSQDDLERAFADGHTAVRERVTLLHCTTEYPAPLESRPDGGGRRCGAWRRRDREAFHTQPNPTGTRPSGLAGVRRTGRHGPNHPRCGDPLGQSTKAPAPAEMGIWRSRAGRWSPRGRSAAARS